MNSEQQAQATQANFVYCKLEDIFAWKGMAKIVIAHRIH